MIRLSNVRLPLEYTDEYIKNICARELRVPASDIVTAGLYRRSIDARRKNDIHYTATIDVTLNTDEKKTLARSKRLNAAIAEPYRYEPITPADPDKRPLIVGAGPAGLFCALTLAQSGVRPILIDRGSRVEDRIRAVESFWKNGELNTECNVQFGEGGAGTFSDGKLNTGTKDSRARKVLLDFVAHGAPDSILYEALPHIGTDKLRDTVRSIREDLIAMGAEVHFDTKLTGIMTADSAVCGAVVEQYGVRKEIPCGEIVLAVGHSARDTFELINRMGLMMEAKAFSVGVRIEHLQEKISRAQYGENFRKLPPAAYKQSVHLKDGRGVYTFCMCPGGVVVAAASEADTVVTNGMSEYARDKANANSALLVTVMPEDIPGDSVLRGMEIQRRLERAAYRAGGGDYKAPVQRAGDFLSGQLSSRFGEVTPSYRPGVSFAKMDDVLPDFVIGAMREALPLIGRKLSGFDHPDAIMTGVESRSSSPVRILRGEDMQSVSLKGLYPCGEGAGYAGGIISAAVDGIKIAEKILTNE